MPSSAAGGPVEPLFHLPFYILFHYLIEKKILKFYSNYQKKYLVYFIPTLLCFTLALDHGRNISLISYHLIAFYLTLLVDKKKFVLLRDRFYKNFLARISLFAFLFFYIFMWKLNQMAGFGLRGIPDDIFQSSLYAELVKFVNFAYDFVDQNIVDLPEINL